MATKPADGTRFQPGEGFARDLDAADSLRGYREQFHIPTHNDTAPIINSAVNSPAQRLARRTCYPARGEYRECSPNSDHNGFDLATS